MKILFLTSHNLATNPRLVKEIRLATENGHEAEVICFEFNNWSKPINDQLLKELPSTRIVSLSVPGRFSGEWLRRKVESAYYKMTARIFSVSVAATSKGLFIQTGLLLQALKKVSAPDLVIGHNPAAMLPSAVAGRRFGCKVAFDMEDYHCGEGINESNQLLLKKIIKLLLPAFNYVSFSSPLIMEQIKKDMDYRAGNWFTVLNYFPSSEFLPPVTDRNGKLKMVWFSQNINTDRGLELIIPILENYKEHAELHLFGNMSARFASTIKEVNNIIIHQPLSQVALHKKLSEFDIGLALEPGKDRNNELAISNKMLAYLQAGLYVLATDTAGQQFVLNNYPEDGILFNRKTDVRNLMDRLIKDLPAIRREHLNRYKRHLQQSWEKEAASILKSWQ